MKKPATPPEEEIIVLQYKKVNGKMKLVEEGKSRWLTDAELAAAEAKSARVKRRKAS